MNKSFAALCTVTALFWGTGMIAENLPGSEWGPIEVNAESFSPVKDIFLRFEQDGRYFGNGGCNTFRGYFVTNEDAILLGPAATTMMACPEEISTQEFTFLQALMSVRSFERNGTMLTLKNAAEDEVLKLRQRDAD